MLQLHCAVCNTPLGEVLQHTTGGGEVKATWGLSVLLCNFLHLYLLQDIKFKKCHEVYMSFSIMVSSEKAMASHSSTLAWKIPWVEETGRLQSMGSRRVGHD